MPHRPPELTRPWAPGPLAVDKIIEQLTLGVDEALGPGSSGGVPVLTRPLAPGPLVQVAAGVDEALGPGSTCVSSCSQR